jgi:hypothetical protein
MTIQTRFEFTLPRGYVDSTGTVHRQGVMRLATAMDEIVPLRDPRVRANAAYLTILLLARVIVQLGSLPTVSETVVENFFAADLAYLQALYRQINEQGVTIFTTACPHCQQAYELDLALLGGASATP